MTAGMQALRYPAQTAYPAPSPAAMPKAAPQLPAIANPREVALQMVDACSNATLTGIEQALWAEHEACSKVDIKGRGIVLTSTTQKGINLSLRVSVIEDKYVKPLNVDTNIRALNEPSRHVFNLLFRACVEKLPLRHNLGVVLLGLEQGVRPERTPGTLAEFNMANSQLLKSYVFATVVKMKPDHGNIIVSAGLKV